MCALLLLFVKNLEDIQFPDNFIRDYISFEIFGSMACTSQGWLKDFDWSLRVSGQSAIHSCNAFRLSCLVQLVLSSDKMSALSKPVVILKLETTKPNGNIEESLIELDSAELSGFIASLKAAQEVQALYQS